MSERTVKENLQALAVKKVLQYAIGVARPVSISVDTFGTGRVSDRELESWVCGHFDLLISVRPLSSNSRICAGRFISPRRPTGILENRSSISRGRNLKAVCSILRGHCCMRRKIDRSLRFNNCNQIRI